MEKSKQLNDNFIVELDYEINGLQNDIKLAIPRIERICEDIKNVLEKRGDEIHCLNSMGEFQSHPLSIDEDIMMLEKLKKIKETYLSLSN